MADIGPPAIFVEIEPWDDADWTSDDRSSEMFPVPELDLANKASDMDARLGWEWKPPGVKWLDPEIYALHRVKGCPSQFPFYRKRTAFFVDLTDMQNLDLEMMELTGHEWVKRYLEEFAERYKRDHCRYLEYVAQHVEVDLWTTYL
ncbi:hypothetical protein DFH07DRAFT_955310 [Mycena maculata]|uniref:Uncharacterized protein n=1 Tax=Mycena maculata TaxID=230809 RepID=A0AAD7NLU3_9AGAR|nr:hypothetical protein DFH07DRAFT_955310 [Mycena maculata]